MQNEIEDTMYKYRKDAGKGTNRDTAAIIVLDRSKARRLPEKDNQEESADYEANDARVGKHLKILIMSLLDTLKSAQAVMRSVGDTERPKARAERHISADNRQGMLPDLGASRSKIRSLCGIGNPCQ